MFYRVLDFLHFFVFKETDYFYFFTYSLTKVKNLVIKAFTKNVNNYLFNHYKY